MVFSLFMTIYFTIYFEIADLKSARLDLDKNADWWWGYPARPIPLPRA